MTELFKISQVYEYSNVLVFYFNSTVRTLVHVYARTRARTFRSRQNLDGVSQPYKSNDVNSGNRLGRAPISKCRHFYRQLSPLFATVSTFGRIVDYDYDKKKMMSKQAKS